MCIAFFAYRNHPQYLLILGFNRDEFYQRPTTPAQFWHDHPDVFAGRDLEVGGTWLGVSTCGRWAAVTNYREPAEHKAGMRSRGLLVRNYLISQQLPAAYLANVHTDKLHYNGFNFLAGTARELWYYSNRQGQLRQLNPGVYAVSNHLLDTPWAKIKKGKSLFQQTLQQSDAETIANEMIFWLSDRQIANDDELPNTGIGLEKERFLSSLFIASHIYGTRSSTVLLWDNNNKIHYFEQSYAQDGTKLALVANKFDVRNQS